MDIVTLTTYGAYEESGDVQHIREFDVPKEWLEQYVLENYNSVDEFLDVYTWDTTIDTYAKASEDNVIVREDEI